MGLSKFPPTHNRANTLMVVSLETTAEEARDEHVLIWTHAHEHDGVCRVGQQRRNEGDDESGVWWRRVRGVDIELCMTAASARLLRWFHYRGWPGNIRSAKENTGKTGEMVSNERCVCACPCVQVCVSCPRAAVER